jgi:acid phosphatase family membrane protein YuiD
LTHDFGAKAVELLLPLHIRLVWDGGVPSAKVFASSALRAMIATIQVEKLQSATFKACARFDRLICMVDAVGIEPTTCRVRVECLLR